MSARCTSIAAAGETDTPWQPPCNCAGTLSAQTGSFAAIQHSISSSSSRRPWAAAAPTAAASAAASTAAAAAAAQTNSITITTPDDWHLHVRDGDNMRSVVPHSAAHFGRAIIMPNLVPPVTTVKLVSE